MVYFNGIRQLLLCKFFLFVGSFSGVNIKLFKHRIVGL